MRTWAGLDTCRPEGELGVGVSDHLVCFGVVDGLGGTVLLTRSIIVKVPAGLKERQEERQFLHCDTFTVSWEKSVLREKEETESLLK